MRIENYIKNNKTSGASWAVLARPSVLVSVEYIVQKHVQTKSAILLGYLARTRVFSAVFCAISLNIFSKNSRTFLHFTWKSFRVPRASKPYFAMPVGK